MPIRSVRLTAAEVAALRELSNRFPASELICKAARNAVGVRCARLAGTIGKGEVAVLHKDLNRIDVLSNEEYSRDSHKYLWESC